MIKLVIFDADGTLYKLKPKECYRKLYGVISEEIGKGAEDIERIHKEIIDKVKCSKDPVKRKLSYSLSLLMEEIRPGWGDNLKDIERYQKIFWGFVSESLEPTDGVGEVKALKGKVRMCVASDEFRKPVEMKLNAVFGNWEDYFEFLVTPEDTGIMKPSENYCILAMEMAGVRPQEAIAIGDSVERDIFPAKRLGIKTCLISGEKDENADFSLKNLKHIREIIEQRLPS